MSRAGYLAGDTFKVKSNTRYQKYSYFDRLTPSYKRYEANKTPDRPSNISRDRLRQEKNYISKQKVFNQNKRLKHLCEQPRNFSSLVCGRFKFIFGFYVVFALLLGFFILNAAVFDAPNLKRQAEATRTIEQVVVAKRGTIYDRNGKILATTVHKNNVVADPTLIDDLDSETKLLSKVIEKKESEIRAALSAPNTRCSIAAKDVSISRGRIVNYLRERGDLRGVFTEETNERQYPFGQVGAQVVGFCNNDGKGLCGLECYYDDILRGKDGYYKAELSEDKAIEIPGSVSQNTPAKDGQDIVISIDINLQAEMEYEVANFDRRPKDADALAISVDAQTGEIYACCSQPFFNPTDLANSKKASTRLRGITDIFEPGSIFKSVTAYAALDLGTTNPNKTYFCPSVLSVEDRKITDSIDRKDINYTLNDIMKNSSNIGISLVAQEMGFDVLNQKISDYQILSDADIDFPGAGCGMVDDFNNWSRHKGMNISFGQGITVTPLQMMRFYCALSNNGYSCNTHFLISKYDSENTTFCEKNVYKPEQLLENQKAINQLNGMLHEVVANGSGKNANIEGYFVCGKTGTAEYVNEYTNNYTSSLYNVSFIGYIPNTQINIVTFAGVYGVSDSVNASSLYKKITEHAIELFSIARNE